MNDVEATNGDEGEEAPVGDEQEEVHAPKQETTLIDLKEFLEGTHPSITKEVRDVWAPKQVGRDFNMELTYPAIRLHCRNDLCGGQRTFRRLGSPKSYTTHFATVNDHPVFTCGDCREERKQYALRITFKDDGLAKLYKYGEIPPFGVPVPNKVLRLFGADAELFKKGRQCENLGYGIGAFAYYRRVVENHKSDLFDEIIKVCKTLGAAAVLIEELEKAKEEVSFSKSMGVIKTGLPEGLLINGHNPLQALHSALSVGLHDESDENCLEDAQAVRLVLSDLVERISQLKSADKQLTQAVQHLMNKKKT